MIDISKYKFDEMRDKLMAHLTKKIEMAPETDFIILDGFVMLPVYKDGEHVGNMINAGVIAKNSKLVHLFSLEDFEMEETDVIAEEVTERIEDEQASEGN